MVGSISRVPTATFADNCASPILYLLPREKDAIEIGNVAIRIAALPASSSLKSCMNWKVGNSDECWTGNMNKSINNEQPVKCTYNPKALAKPTMMMGMRTSL